MKIGEKVQIRHSNGRCCEAFLTEILQTQRLVAVNWMEGEELKGKKITFDSLSLFNPNLVIDEVESSSKETAPKPSSETKEVASEAREFLSIIPCSQRPLKMTGTSDFFQSKKEKTEFAKAIQKGFITTRRSMAPRSCNKLVAPPSDKPKMEKPLSLKAEISSAKRQEPLRVHYNNKEFISMINEYRKQLPCQSLSVANFGTSNNRITVCVRVRPLNEREISKNQFNVVTVAKRDVIILHQPQMKVDTSKVLENQTFRFDYVFDEGSSNDLVYQ
ncbi:Kinesin-like protein KIF2A [Trichinella pseudospiralis]|uniref:Kinesin-like protein KIF2A n=2 Tax=Trichinella pseudospiralis TaxID=6337 RepID=A0A0V1F463_TRIPS|nr:Kinesin-like protein KIF2A [Trichinella pseudospiralis]KRY80848.1 Kinesin-like protein KIF2A [Trichinella pseudospiralis]KRY80850.1 Kinesin-like protein KIF2A [Trichinella pseudospiralis]